MTIHSTVFNSVHTVAKYLYHLNNEISPIKLQKSLYFLFAYYGALYGINKEDGVFEGSPNSPRYLFDSEFEAWKYGPVIREVFNVNKQDGYQEVEIIEAVKEVVSKNEVKSFIDELFNQINSVSDFGLVDRSHQDFVWKNAFKSGILMDKDHIIDEYMEKYVTQ
ncbi:Panacea domain-containing protein [Bacillus sp. DJP31]|uniref:Panacea domain-containing protein n=1 Tax=Bacillus sp. DJP31 TaxID=3409789 RepID=UPI003BB7FB33